MSEPEKVETLARLAELAEQKRAVTVIGGWPAFKRKPAAFVINMSGAIIDRMFKAGMYVYEKQEKTK